MLSDPTVSPYGEPEHNSMQSFKLMQLNKLIKNQQTYWGVKSANTVYKNGYRLTRRSVLLSSGHYRIQFLPHPQLVEPIDQLYSHLVHVVSTTTCAPSSLFIDPLKIRSKPAKSTPHLNTPSGNKAYRRNFKMSSSLVKRLKGFSCRLVTSNHATIMAIEKHKIAYADLDSKSIMNKDLRKVGKHTSHMVLSKVSMMESGYTSYDSRTTIPRTSLEINAARRDYTKTSPSTDVGSTLKMELCQTDNIISCFSAITEKPISKLTAYPEETNKYHQVAPHPRNKTFRYFSKQNPAIDLDKVETINDLDEFLPFVKEEVLQIRMDLSEFKEDCKQNIDAKVTYTEFSDTTKDLRAKIASLERKLLIQHCLMCQEVYECKERISVLEVESICGIKNYTIWPWLIFISTYSIINFGRR